MSVDHSGRIKSALAYMEANLARNIVPENVANHAGMSYFHFLRLFQALTGETPASYLRKRRLSEASRRIVAGDRIIEVAIDSGFDSQEAFTRAFKKRFHMAPGEYRDHTPTDLAYFGPLDWSTAESDKINRLCNTQGTLCTLPDLQLAGMERHGRNIGTLNCRLIMEMGAWVAHQGLDCPMIALSGEENPHRIYAYKIGCRLPPGSPVPPGLSTFGMAAGAFVHFTFRGLPDILNGNIYSWIYGYWVTMTGQIIDTNRLTIEVFPRNYQCLEQSSLDFYLPLVARPDTPYPDAVLPC